MSPTDNRDKFFMRMALNEARKGVGRTAPNPCVGAVIVKDGRLISTGYHKKAGTPHAEIHALRKAGTQARDSTLYVTLEPCSHMGRTPPCSHAVVQGGIKKVVIGLLDPNPLVDGGGIQYLRDHGVEVTTGVLPEECRSINLPFLKFITTGLPLMILKAGVSLDGRLNYESGRSGWITGPRSTEKVHQLRNMFDAILVGSNTITIDNPSLTTRLKGSVGRDPIRIILDSNLTISSSAKVINQESDAPAWIFCDSNIDNAQLRRLKQSEQSGLKIFPVENDASGHLDLEKVVTILGQNNVTSVLVEGGGSVHGSFLKKQLFDRACLFLAPLFAGSNGVSLTSGLSIDGRDSAIGLENVCYTRLGDDIMVEGDVHYPDSK